MDLRRGALPAYIAHIGGTALDGRHKLRLVGQGLAVEILGQALLHGCAVFRPLKPIQCLLQQLAFGRGTAGCDAAQESQLLVRYFRGLDLGKGLGELLLQRQVWDQFCTGLDKLPVHLGLGGHGHALGDQVHPAVQLLRLLGARGADEVQHRGMGLHHVGRDAAAAVTELADRLHIPVVNTMMAKGIIPMDDKYSLWTIGIPQKDYVNQLFDRADLVIAIGYDIVECAPAKWGARPDMAILHIDSAPADVNKRYQPAVEVVGDISESIYEILRCTRRDSEPEFALRLREMMVAEHTAMADDDSCSMKPARILSDVRKVMGRDDILVSDVGAHKMWVARHYDCYEPNTCLISNGFASMGFSIPGAFAAKLLNPDKKVLAVCGDGGFMMNSQELETAVREKVPFVTLIWEDSSYGLIKWKEQEQFSGEHCYVDFSNPDFKLLAEAMHCKGYRVEKAADLIPTLEEAFRQTVPSVIVVPVDYSENMKLSAHLKEVYTK